MFALRCIFRAIVCALAWLGAGAILPAAVLAEPTGTLRLAVFHADLSRSGPGLLLNDLLRRDTPPDILRAAEIIRSVKPDVLLLQGFDYDAERRALSAFNRLIGEGEAAFPHLLSERPNTGLQTGLDLDGDGRIGTPRDAQGYGRFAGEGGMALLSRYPLEMTHNFTALLWRDLPGAMPPHHRDGSAFPSEKAFAMQRLSTTAHWAVHLTLPNGTGLTLLAYHATPPVFDGEEDRNGRRAVDEHRLWLAYLDGTLAQPPPNAPFVLIGTGNLDPMAGYGDRAFMATLLADPRWQDPELLRSKPTGFWPTPIGPLRASYILPAVGLSVKDAGIFPGSESLGSLGSDMDPGGAHQAAGDFGAPIRRLVWLDLTLGPPSQ